MDFRPGATCLRLFIIHPIAVEVYQSRATVVAQYRGNQSLLRWFVTTLSTYMDPPVSVQFFPNQLHGVLSLCCPSIMWTNIFIWESGSKQSLMWGAFVLCTLPLLPSLSLSLSVGELMSSFCFPVSRLSVARSYTGWHVLFSWGFVGIDSLVEPDSRGH